MISGPAAAAGELTMDDLTSLHRIEMRSGTLSDVRRDLYPAMVALMEQVNREYEKNNSADPLSIITEGANTRRMKVATMMRRVTELRMNKVASLALRNSMGAMNPVEQLPPEEREYYDKVLNASLELWNVVNRKKRVTIPDIAPEVEERPAPKPVPAPEPAPKVDDAKPEPVPEDVPLDQMPFIDDGPDAEMPEPPDDEFEDIQIPPEEGVEVVDRTPAPEPEPEMKEDLFEDESNKVIWITENIPPFSGPERDYHLKKGDVVKMPTIMADVLLGRSMATELIKS